MQIRSSLNEYWKYLDTINNISLQSLDKGAVYFIGIGGIGMSALARYFKFHGYTVSGYDKTPSDLTRQLEGEGIAVHFDERPDLVPEHPVMVVYTPAIPVAHLELVLCKTRGFRLMKRSEVLGFITENSFNLCVAGTHGKTTTTTMVAHLLRDTGYGCNAFLGGISANYNSNFWNDEREVAVVEADEYDRSFLKLSPDRAVITSMDADHLDIYGTHESMEASFEEFTARLKTGGLLLLHHSLKNRRNWKVPRLMTYDLENPEADIHTRNRILSKGGYLFDLVVGARIVKDIFLPMGGLHNIENVTAAIALALDLGIEEELIIKAVASFKGVRRRFEYVVRKEDKVLIDDYAHHPAELKALVTGVRSLFGTMKCLLIFQPHLFSRTRDFVQEFAEVLDTADETVLLPIYPARELPMEGVSSDWLLSLMHSPNKHLLEKEAVMSWLEKKNLENTVVVVAGAGDIDRLVLPVSKLMEK